MNPQKKLDDAELYAQCMERLKRRIDAAQRLLRRETGTGALITDVEFLALQLRKILEGIALASICAHRPEYERIRDKIWKDWNARYITQDIERINPAYFPTALEIKDGPPDPETGIRPLRPRTDGFLTKEQFLKYYTKTARLLHEDNPFAGFHNEDLQKLYNEFGTVVPLVIGLLNKHQIQPRTDVMWIVQMHVPPDNKVHVTNFERINE